MVLENSELKNKTKAQISAFVIVAILIIGVIGIYFVLKSDVLGFGKERITPQVLPVYSFVENCIKATGEDAVYHVGQTGGYFISPNLSTDNKVAYYFYNKNNIMPAKERIEKELADYMDNMLFFCMKNFNDFPDFNIKQGEIETGAKIENGYVMFDIVYPLSIEKEGKSYFISKFGNNRINVRLNVIYDILYKIMQEQMKHKEDICISCISDLGDENDVYFNLYNYDEKTVVFVITDKNSKIKGEDYNFYFANEY